MSFYDLPKNWHALSLADPRLAADVVDLVVSEADRASGCLSVLLCDERERLVQPVTITDIPRGEPHEHRRVLDLTVGELATSSRRLGGVVVVIGRPRGQVPDDDARAWHEAVIAACRGHAVHLIGTYVATVHGVVHLPRWDGLRAVS